MRLKPYLLSLLACPALLLGSEYALAQSTDLPVSVIYSGTIAAASNGLKPTKGEAVQVLNNTSGAIEATGSIEDDAGTFLVQMSKPAGFNGTPITFKLDKAQARYDLLQNGQNVVLSFSGSFLPAIRTLALTLATTSKPLAGTGTGTGTGSGTGTGTGTDSGSSTTESAFDINGDGKVDETDVALAKAAIAGAGTVTAKMDVNKDGIFNTRDVIDVIRAARANPKRPSAALPSGGLPPAATTTTTTSK